MALTATMVMGILMLAVDRAFPAGGSIWRDWATDQETLVYFCEPATVAALFRQKIDVYSNLGFFFVGVWLVASGLADRGRLVGGHAIVHPTWSWWFGIAAILTFLGSTLFHASLTRSGEALDLAGTYATALLPGFFNLHRLCIRGLRRRITPLPFVAAWLAVWLLSSLFIFTLSSRVVVPGALILIGLTGFILFWQVRPRKGWWYAFASIVLTVVAASFFVMDIEKVGCEPSSWYQAHSIWHLLAAAAAASYYGFMRQLPAMDASQNLVAGQ